MIRSLVKRRLFLNIHDFFEQLYLLQAQRAQTLQKTRTFYLASWLSGTLAYKGKRGFDPSGPRNSGMKAIDFFLLCYP
jgi:hypothetical protein